MAMIPPSMQSDSLLDTSPGVSEITRNSLDDESPFPTSAENSPTGQKPRHIRTAYFAVLVGLGLWVGMLAKGRLFPELPLAAVEETPTVVTEPKTEETPEVSKPGAVPPMPSEGSDVPPVEDDDWGLPAVDTADTRLSTAALRGKQFLAASIPQQEADAKLFDDEKEVLEAVASAVTKGETKGLIGLYLDLENVAPFDESDGEGSASSRTFKVTKFLGKGSSCLVLEILDENAQEKYALRIFLLENLRIPLQTVAQLGRKALQLEESSARRACGRTPPAVVASQKGLLVPQYTGRIAGLPEVTMVGKFHVFSSVQLTERLRGDLGSILPRRRRLPIEAKEYIASRLVLQVLHLQEAGVCHADLRLENCLMREDGSFLLGDFGVSAAFGEPMHELSKITVAYAEPQFLLDFNRFLHSDASVSPDAGTDIWGLGALLFELFTNGKLPYGATEAHNNLAEMCTRANNLIDNNASPTDLLPELERADTPQRWLELVLRLLEPRRENRITGREIAEKFGDLFGSSDS